MLSVRSSSLALFVALTAAGSFGCSAAPHDADSSELQEDPGVQGEGVSGALKAGQELKATANVNLRKGPSTGDSVLHVIPSDATVTVVDATPSNGFYKVKHNGSVGWSSGKYFVPVGGSAGSVANGSSLTATAGVNLRKGPDTTYAVIEVVPSGADVTVVDGSPQNGFYKVDYKGTVGWSSAQYYTKGSGDPNGGGGNPDPGGGGSAVDDAIARAKSAVGFSYWWGHGRFLPAGPGGGKAGSCSGSCPNCSHGGSYGGDCSGLVAKVWQVPASNNDITADSHPYSTGTFVTDSSQWKTVSRANLKKADAMVYNSGGEGHIFLYSSGDGWGSMYAYECKGCSYGCVAGYRTASSAYHGIRKVGF